MPDSLIDTPDALDAAIESARQTRRRRLLRATRNQKIRTRVALGFAACTSLFALAAFVYGDREAATVIALLACLTFGSTYVAGKAGRRKVADSVRELDRST
jgi:hypothetical protein